MPSAAAPAPAPTTADGAPRLTVLVVAGDADLRRYVIECLRARGDVRVVEAATVGSAQQLARECALALIITDARASEALVTRSECRGVVLVDEVPREDAADGGRVRWLARPFTGRELLAAVRVALG